MNQATKTPTGHGYSASQTIASFDTELWDAMSLETQRQEEHIELIASENYASPRVPTFSNRFMLYKIFKLLSHYFAVAGILSPTLATNGSSAKAI